MKRISLLGFSFSIVLFAPNAIAQQPTTDQRLEILERKVDRLFRHLGIQPEPPSTPAGNINLQFGQPTCAGKLLVKQYYVICYQSSWKIPSWVTYHLSAEDLKGNAARKDDFRPDPELPEGERSELSDYRNSGFDKGHMAPAADFKRSPIAISETFLLSNIAPQTPNLNRRMWQKLEGDVRSLAGAHGSIWVFTGSLFLDQEHHPTQPTKHIGKDQVTVPTHFYKVILCQHSNEFFEMFAFVMPNQREVPEGKPQDYIVTVDEVQHLSGLDFFSTLPQQLQSRLEAMKATNWPIQ